MFCFFKFFLLPNSPPQLCRGITEMRFAQLAHVFIINMTLLGFVATIVMRQSFLDLYLHGFPNWS